MLETYSIIKILFGHDYKTKYIALGLVILQLLPALLVQLLISFAARFIFSKNIHLFSKVVWPSPRLQSA